MATLLGWSAYSLFKMEGRNCVSSLGIGPVGKAQCAGISYGRIGKWVPCLVPISDPADAETKCSWITTNLTRCESNNQEPWTPEHIPNATIHTFIETSVYMKLSFDYGRHGYPFLAGDNYALANNIASSKIQELDILPIILIHFAAAEVVPFLQPGFFFNYNKADEPVPILLTEQCEVIHLKWGRRAAIGYGSVTKSVAPYSLVGYTSTSTAATVIDAGSPSDLSFDWAVPFAPGTQYQICMFDSNGAAGGCQDMHTMIPNSNGTDVSCPNVTSPVLSANGTVSQPNGPLSQYAFITQFKYQCTDVSVTLSEGTPPFTLTIQIAPTLHPQYNLTSNTMDPITWTVSLSRAMPFFMSMVSSDGKIWVNGPLHVGAGPDTDCLAPGTVNAAHAKSVAGRAGVGGLFGGAILVAGILIVLFLWTVPSVRIVMSVRSTS
ncbi:hypothetical protein IW262DRAFT_1467966 [Armillaria fumosa]|nr:hypothetical protein IW262DRAFT_1467966 [Armillaria fumosa]